MLYKALWHKRNVWVNVWHDTFGNLILQAWTQAKDRQIVPLPSFLTLTDGRVLWRKPPNGALKINVYVANF